MLEQEFVKDGELTVAKYIEGVAKKLGGTIMLLNMFAMKERRN